MHYYIDGYNLLFRVRCAADDLKTKREQVVQDLSEKIRFLGLEATLVFDSQYQLDEGQRRSHLQQIEILFSSHGETADELILDELKNEKNPAQITVVTSDKKLAWLARRKGVKTETVEDFMVWLNKRVHNKVRHQTKGVQPGETKKEKSDQTLIQPEEKKNSLKPPSKKISAEECFEYYLSHFEAVVDKQQEIKASKQAKIKSTPPKKKKIPKHASEKEGVSEMERWLKIFESPPEDDFQ